MSTPHILIVDDDPNTCDLIESGLKRRGFSVTCSTVPEQALALIDQQQFTAVITDLQMEGVDGLEVCRRIVAKVPGLPVIVVTGFGSIESATGAIRAGAYDFIAKPFDLEHLGLVVRRAVDHRELSQQLISLRSTLNHSTANGEMIGTSATINSVRSLIERASQSDATVLITGDSGTGKELIAKELHRLSKRANGPFVALNCAALPDQLLESELFGHVKGAYTDAVAARTGLFVTASGGTLFLDEIGEMPMSMQVKLLRALQERTVRPIGANQEIAFNTRVIAATNRDLEAEVKRGRFREDLLYRINVVGIRAPALKEREGDILLLAQYFIDRFAAENKKPVSKLSIAAAEKLMAHPWKGNVRELQNCIARAVALAEFEHILVRDLPDHVRAEAPATKAFVAPQPSEMPSLDEIEKLYVEHVLKATGGNKTRAAEILGFDRKTLYRKLGRYEVEGQQQDESTANEPAAIVAPVLAAVLSNTPRVASPAPNESPRHAPTT